MKKEQNRGPWIDLLLPLLFLTVTLLGGLRLGAADNAFIFLRPELICLVFGAVAMIVFFRSGLIDLRAFFSENSSAAQNISNGIIMFSLFTASVQAFNSILPEKGLAFWVIGFVLLWTLWNYLFFELSPKKLLQSFGGVLGLAFIAKYILLASLASPEETLTQRIFSSLMKEASFGLLDLPKFSPATGYLQFVTLGLYLMGLALLYSMFAAGANIESSSTSSETTS